MAAGGRDQFLPFIVTVLAIVFTDLLVGVVIGLGVALAFILRSNMNRPVRRIVEKHLGGDVTRIELANQVSFLNRAAIDRVLSDLTTGDRVLFDARGTDYIDPDVYELIRDFRDRIGPARGMQVSLLGFRKRYELADDIQYVDYSTRDLQAKLTPAQVLDILKAGHERFASGQRLTRDLGRQVQATGAGQHPLAVVVGCIDSRAPSELLFDLGLGDIFSARVAGNCVGPKMLASVEYATAAAGAKLVLVLGHTRCGAVTAAVEVAAGVGTVEATGCQHIEAIVDRLRPSIDPAAVRDLARMTAAEREVVVNAVAARHVGRMVRAIQEESRTMADLVAAGRVAVVGAVYDVTSGRIAFLPAGHEVAAAVG
jgi:carbonic anhydrase/SulP family sulfate permease